MVFILFVIVHAIVKSHQIVNLKCVDLLACKLFLSKVNEEREG